MRRTTESHFICCNMSKSKSTLVILIHNAKDWKKNICGSALRIIWALRCLFTCCVFPENWNRNLPVLKLLFLSRLLLEPGAQAVPLRQLRKVLRFLPEFDEPRSSARRKDHVSGMWKSGIHSKQPCPSHEGLTQPALIQSLTNPLSGGARYKSLKHGSAFHSLPCRRFLELWLCWAVLSERQLWKARALPVQSVWQEVWESEEFIEPPGSARWKDHLHDLWKGGINQEQPESTREDNPPRNLCHVSVENIWIPDHFFFTSQRSLCPVAWL